MARAGFDPPPCQGRCWDGDQTEGKCVGEVLGHTGPHSPPAPGLGWGAASLHLKKSNVEVITLKICSRMGFCVAPGARICRGDGARHAGGIVVHVPAAELHAVPHSQERAGAVHTPEQTSPCPQTCRVPMAAVSPRLRSPPVPPQGRVSVWVPHEIGLRSFKCLN